MKRSPLPPRKHPLRRTPIRRNKRIDMEWQEAKVKALLRSRGLCCACLPGCQTIAHTAHHRLRRSQGGLNDAANLIPVCVACHDWIHANPLLSHQLGLLDRSTTTRKEPE